MSYPGGKGGLQEDQGPTDDEIRRAGYTPFKDRVMPRNSSPQMSTDETGLGFKDRVSVKPPFETTEQRGLYKLATGFSDAVQVAADSLAFLAKFGAFMGPGEREQMAALQGKLNQACSFES